MRISDWSSDVCSSDLGHVWRHILVLPLLAFFVLALLDRLFAPAARLLGSGAQLGDPVRSEEHPSELQSLMRTSYAVFCLKKKNHTTSKRSRTRHAKLIISCSTHNLLTSYKDHT